MALNMYLRVRGEMADTHARAESRPRNLMENMASGGTGLQDLKYPMKVPFIKKSPSTKEAGQRMWANEKVANGHIGSRSWKVGCGLYKAESITYVTYFRKREQFIWAVVRFSLRPNLAELP